MNTRTMAMYMNDFGANRHPGRPLLRVAKPTSHVVDALLAVANVVVSATDRAIAAIVDWHRERRTCRLMAQLDDHVLRDIGLTRDGLPSAMAALNNRGRHQDGFERRR